MIKNSLKSFNWGLTAIEMMITLAIAAVVLAMGIPGLKSLVANNQMNATTNDLVTHLQYARSESIKRMIPVSACSSADGRVCADSTDWGAGWIVFTDDSGESGILDGSDKLLRSYQPTGTVVSVTSDKKFVRYRTDGSISM